MIKRRAYRRFSVCMIVSVVLCGSSCPPEEHPIVFVSDRDGDAEIYTMATSPNTEKQLTFDPLPDLGPKWSPDKKQIVFLRGDKNSRDIFLMNRDGTDVRRLLESDGDESRVAWSPTGDAIAFIREWQDANLGISRSALYVLWLAGGGPVKLVDDPTDWASPQWSPDGLRVAIVTTVSTTLPPYFRVYVVEVRTGEGRFLFDTEPGSTPESFSPAWSPTGDHLACLRRYYRKDGLWKAEPEIGVASRLWERRVDVQPVYWREGGILLRQRDQTYLIDPLQPENIRKIETGFDPLPDSSGDRVLFVFGDTFPSEQIFPRNHLWLATIDGGDATRLTSGSGRNHSPDW